ncbi:hypothetical protein [Gordonibacter pamelaeae]
MTTTTMSGEVMRVVLPPTLKARFQSKCADQGQNMSERMRQLIAQDLAQEATPADRLTAILASAERKNRASGLSTPTIDDVDAFIDAVRAERIRDGIVS